MSAPHQNARPATPHADSAFIRTCRGQDADHTPVWFMRQAGRSLPEYRSIRGSGTILRAIADADLATEITLQPVRRYGVDAAILYSDIMTPVHAIGFGVDIDPGVGPVVEEPFAGRADLDRLRPLDPEADTPVRAGDGPQPGRATCRCPSSPSPGRRSPSPATCWKGGPSRTYVRTKALMHSDESLWFDLLDRLADLAIASLRSQVAEGAAAVQLFDSWAGALSPQHYERFVLPASTKVLDAVADLGVPRIHFGVSTGELLGLMASAGADVVGVDWRTPLDAARDRVPAGTTLQGNLDPAVVAAGWAATEAEALDVLRRGGRPRPRVQPGTRRPARDRPRRPWSGSWSWCTPGARHDGRPHGRAGPGRRGRDGLRHPGPAGGRASRTTPTSAGDGHPPRSSWPS